jgi:prolyl oligopeptidase
VLLCGYGGVDVAITPHFSATWAVWLERGGMLAVASLRLRSMARRLRLVACGPVAISGGSNGGLLVGACLTQHPELFGAAVANVGVFDMLRFHRRP